MNLRQIRKGQNMSQTELAGLMGVTQPTISCWEDGTYSPTVVTIRKLVEIFKCTSDELLGLSVTENTQAEHRA
jgi:transcriptional regulator with XRE-family HTH domain